jgi:predicted aminopeptidase
MMHSWPIVQRSITGCLCGTLLFFQGCSVGYLVHLGIGEAKIITGSKPIDKVLSDPSLPQEAHHKLALILEAKEYAEKTIGLTPSKAYTKYYHVPGPVVAYSLTASPRLELLAYRWCFPIVGCIPYKGFFSLDRAQREQRGMEEKKFDTYLRGVAAYSTLGWFLDPVFSTMLSYNEATLVEIVIHEMVHHTIFLPHKVEFNEGIATFLGQEGAREFLEKRFGPNAEPCLWARDREEDDRIFQEFVKRLKDRLTALYSSPLSDTDKMVRKRDLLDEARRDYQGLLPRFRTAGYDGLLRKEWNNALIISYLTYLQDLNVYEQVFQRLGLDLKRTVEFFKGFEKVDNPEESILQWLSSQRGQG